MRILLDTNVLIAAFISPRGRCAEIIEHCAKAHGLVSSPALLEEFREKLVFKFRLAEETAVARVELLRAQIKVIAPARLSIPVCRDPDDDDVLAAAQAGGCHCIITGDQDLLVLSRFEGIAIVAPGDFAAFESTMQS